VATLEEIERYYSIEDLANANDALDAVAELRESLEASAAAEAKKNRGLLP
jgi:hypothetical protein